MNGLSLSQKCAQEVTIKQQLTSRLTLTQKHTLLEALATRLREMRDASVSPDERLTSAIADTNTLLRSSDHGKTFLEETSELLNDPFFPAALYSAARPLLFAPRTGSSVVAAELVAQSAVAENPEIGVSASAIRTACTLPNSAEHANKKHQELLELVRSKKVEPTEGLMQEIREAQTLQRLVQDTAEFRKAAASVIEFLVTTPTPASSPIQRALMEGFLLDHCDFLASERLLKRFAAMLEKSSPDTRNIDRLRVPFVNILGEYALMGLGIISPDLFRVVRASVDEKNPTIEEAGTVRTLLDRFGLRSEAFFYSRYAIQGVRPSAATDDFIRDFITSIPRKDAALVAEETGLNAFIGKYDDFLNEEAPNPKQKREWLESNGLEYFQEAEEGITRCLKERWFPALVASLQSRGLLLSTGITPTS